MKVRTSCVYEYSPIHAANRRVRLCREEQKDIDDGQVADGDSIDGATESAETELGWWELLPRRRLTRTQVIQAMYEVKRPVQETVQMMLKASEDCEVGQHDMWLVHADGATDADNDECQ